MQQVPPHIGKGTRVVFPSNCHLPKKRRKLSAKHKVARVRSMMAVLVEGKPHAFGNTIV